MIVGVVGVGLLGGSIGYILKKKGWAEKVIGIGRNIQKLNKALEMEAIDIYVTEYDNRLKSVDIFILAIPVEMIASKIEEIMLYAKEGAIFTDVGSTKSKVTSDVERVIAKCLDRKLYFVGGHPMAGSEKTGVEALDPFLFENAVYVLTKSCYSSDYSISKIREMAEILGAKVVEMDCRVHDTAVGTVSHLPHIAASALVNTAAKLNITNSFVMPLAAGGFRDTTRVASGSPEMWRDICISNKEVLREIINEYKKNLDEFQIMLDNYDEKSLYSYFMNAKENRDKLPKNKKGIISPMQEFVVYVPDVLGIIGKVTQILGDNNINIRDIEVLHIRENEGGSLRIGVDLCGNYMNAAEVLVENGFKVKEID